MENRVATMNRLTYKINDSLGFKIYPRKFGDKLKEIDSEHLFQIGYADFQEILQQHIEIIYPLHHGETNKLFSHFEVCLENVIPKCEWMKILESIYQVDYSQNKILEAFVDSFCTKLDGFFEWADEVRIDGEASKDLQIAISKRVSTNKEAIAYAEEISYIYYSRINLEEYDAVVKYESEKELWTVYYSLKAEVPAGEEYRSWMYQFQGGGGPCLIFTKSGIIIAMYLMK